MKKELEDVDHRKANKAQKREGKKGLIFFLLILEAFSRVVDGKRPRKDENIREKMKNNLKAEIGESYSKKTSTQLNLIIQIEYNISIQ